MKGIAQPMHATIIAKVFDRERLARIVDGLAIALAVSLPWSTTATEILAGLWFLALIPTLDHAILRRVLLTPAGGFSVLLCALGLVGMLWADVPLDERIDGFRSYYKLLFIPLVMFHFCRSERGMWVMIGFLISCGVLLAVSWGLLLITSLPWRGKITLGIPVKDYISQSAMFTLCIFILADIALDAWRRTRRDVALVLVLLALAFLANIFYIATSRTALVVLPILFLLFGLKRFDWKGTMGLLGVLVVLGAAAWLSSEHLRVRVITLAQEIHAYSAENAGSSAGERLEFWRKSLKFVTDAPLIGHGTGTIREQFHRSVVAESGVSALVSANPHNQTLAVAIQLGLVGTIALYAMWISHLLLFRGEGLVAWIGLVVVVQNMVGSLFNSHLFDFTQGWGYVIGVGVAGGLMLRNAFQIARNANPPPEERQGQAPL
jgi:O-antigen ligase